MEQSTHIDDPINFDSKFPVRNLATVNLAGPNNLSNVVRLTSALKSTVIYATLIVGLEYCASDRTVDNKLFKDSLILWHSRYIQHLPSPASKVSRPQIESCVGLAVCCFPTARHLTAGHAGNA